MGLAGEERNLSAAARFTTWHGRRGRAETELDHE